jgi:hypothetical protein
MACIIAPAKESKMAWKTNITCMYILQHEFIRPSRSSTEVIYPTCTASVDDVYSSSVPSKGQRLHLAQCLPCSEGGALRFRVPLPEMWDSIKTTFWKIQKRRYTFWWRDKTVCQQQICVYIIHCCSVVIKKRPPYKIIDMLLLPISIFLIHGHRIHKPFIECKSTGTNK